MPAELDRNATRWIGRPQVGRFYGDFLCMASIRENKIFSGIRRRISEKSFKSNVWPQSGRARNDPQPIGNIGGFQRKIGKNMCVDRKTWLPAAAGIRGLFVAGAAMLSNRFAGPVNRRFSSSPFVLDKTRTKSVLLLQDAG